MNNVLGLKNFGTNGHDFANLGLQRGRLETMGIGSTIRDLYSHRFRSRDLGFTILDLGYHGFVIGEFEHVISKSYGHEFVKIELGYAVWG